MPLGKRTDCRNARFAGVIPEKLASVADGIQEAIQIGFDFVAVSLNHKDLNTGQVGPYTCIKSDLELTSSTWNSQVIGRMSNPIPQTGCETLENIAATQKIISSTVHKELSWASYLGLQAALFTSVENIPQELVCILAQSFSSFLANKSIVSIWIQIRLQAGEQNASVKKWQTIRSLCDYHNQVRAALVLSKDLPKKHELLVWYGEPVKAVIIPTSIFVKNSRGYPTLPKLHQEFIAALFLQGIQFLVQDDSIGHDFGFNVIESAQTGGPLDSYFEYLSYLFRRLEPLTEIEQMEFEYRDYLQSPLQPLQDHLESATYEVFERDRTKYLTYEEAVYKALLDRFSPDGERTRTPVVMVVGAGRGPLVKASIQASRRAQIEIKVYAVEKNPSAYITLLDLHQREQWGDTVTIVHQDMRYWDAKEKADILVSELLGSFGDNELSPECLDGAQRFLVDGGISIPQSYTSYLAPITHTKLFEEIKAGNELKHLETPYVVKLFSYTLLADNQEVFTFRHPNYSNTIDNARFKPLCFIRSEQSPAAVLHGFAGYFEAVLYGDVLLSIRPETHTPDMFSWFPIFFPLPRPVFLQGGAETISVDMWRCCAKHKVWYEYALTSPEVMPIVNPQGRAYAAEL